MEKFERRRKVRGGKEGRGGGGGEGSLKKKVEMKEQMN